MGTCFTFLVTVLYRVAMVTVLQACIAVITISLYRTGWGVAAGVLLNGACFHRVVEVISVRLQVWQRGWHQVYMLASLFNPYVGGVFFYWTGGATCYDVAWRHCTLACLLPQPVGRRFPRRLRVVVAGTSA